MALCIFMLSAFSSWYGDDMAYKYFCTGINGESGELNSILDIIPSINNYYITGEGRYVAHVLVQLFCAFLGPITFGIFNALAYMALTILILSFTGTSIYNIRSLLSVVILIILCFSTKMMPSCQIGYIWSFVVALTFIKIFLKTERMSQWLWLPLFMFAIIAGNFHEGVNFGVAGALFIWFIVNLRHISAQQWIILIGFGIGVLINILSPGARYRAANGHAPLSLSIVNLFHYGLGLYVLGGALIAVWRNKHTSFKFKKFVKTNYFFLSAVIFSLVLNMAISIGTSRQLYGMNLFCIIVALNILPRKSMSTFWIIITGILAALHLTVQAHNTCKMRKFDKDLDNQLATIDGLPGQTATIFIDCYPASQCWYSPLDSYVENNGFIGKGNLKKLKLELSHLYPDKEINVLPKDLRSLDSVNNDSGIIQTSDGNYLIYTRNGHRPPRLKAIRTIGLPGTSIKKSHSDVIYDMDMTDEEVYRYRDFKSILVSQWSYSPLIQIVKVEKMD